MSTTFILLATLSYLSRSECFSFYLARNLTSTEELPKDNWSRVEVLGTETENVDVKIDIPAALSHTDVFIFFANDAKEILRVELNDTVKGSFYSMPHKLVKETKAGTTSTTEDEKIHQISGTFPQSWLPENFTKISGAVKISDGVYYNYYGIQNFDIAIPDMMVVEEFKAFQPE